MFIYNCYNTIMEFDPIVFRDFIRDKFAEWRGKGRESLADYAEYIGVSQQVASNWYNGGLKQRPNPKLYNFLIEKYGVEAYDVLGLPRPPASEFFSKLPPEYSEMIQKVILDVNQKYPYKGEDVSQEEKQEIFDHLVTRLLWERYNQLSVDRLGVSLPREADLVIRDKSGDVVTAIELTHKEAIESHWIMDKTSGSRTEIAIASPESLEKIKERFFSRLESIIDKEQVAPRLTEH